MTSDDFETRHVKEVVSFAKGKPPVEQPYFGSDAELYLTPEYLRGGAISEPIKANKNAVRVSGGETIVLWDGSNAGEVFRARPGVLSSTMVHLKPENSFDDDYFFYAMKGWEGYLKGQTSGSGIPHVDKEVLGKLALLRYSINEQVKIAEILATVDQAIEQTEALIAKQQRIKTGLMQDLLTRGIDEHGQLRTEQTQAFKDSPLGRIPVEWEVQKLGALLKDIHQGWSPDCESDPADIGCWGVLKTTAVVWHGYQDFENKALPEKLQARDHLEIKAGDILMTRAGPNSRVGVLSYVRKTREKLMLSDKIYRLVPSEKMDGRFLCHALASGPTQQHLSNLKTGMAESQTNISQEIVKALLAFVPSKIEQLMIADRIDKMNNEVSGHISLNKLRSLKTALMQDLLTGHKRVTDLLGPVAA